MSTPQPFDPYSYASSQAAPATFDPYEYANSASQNPGYVAPAMGPGNTWGQAIENAPQAAAAGVNRWGFDVLGTPMDAATNVANLGKAAAGYVESKITGKTPPEWSLPTDPANEWGTSEWLKAQAAKQLGTSVVEPNNPQSALDQGLTAGFETVGPAPLFAGAPTSIEGVPTQSASTLDHPQSLSAAAASQNLSGASPELRHAVQAATENGEPVNQDVLARHVQAETLPIPARLTKGQATQDPMLLSQEQNQRGANGSFATHFDAQNKNLAANMEVMRDTVGPDVHTTNPVEHGQALIDAYQAKANAADADINAKYQALRDANGGQFPVDSKALYQNVSAALHKDLLFEHAPSAELGQLQKLSTGSMTLEQFEAMRTNLARVMRSSSDGNEKAAAGVIRQQMEALPLSSGTAQVKALADTARGAARTQFQALNADPAYKAAVNGTVTPDRFVSRFLVNGARDDVATMRANLGDNEVATQTMGTAALGHLRDAARLDDQFRGNFAAQSYNKALSALGPKLSSLFSPKQIEDLTNIGDVARYETAQPRGSFVNNSNTNVAQVAEYGKNVAEQAVNAKTMGIGGTLARKFLKGAAERKLFREHTSAGAGITWAPQGAP